MTRFLPRLGGVEHRLHAGAGMIDEAGQLLAIGFEVGNRRVATPLSAGGLGDGGGDALERRGSNGFGIR